MQPKFKVGDVVRFKEKEFKVPSIDSLSVSLNTEKLFGKVVEVIDKGPDGFMYMVDVKLSGITWNVPVNEDQLMSIRDFIMSMFDQLCKPIINFDSLCFDRIEMPFLRDPKRYVLGFDLGVPQKPEPQKVNDGKELKMPKSRCIKLLESYRAEREKVKKGRRFERCLRDSVVDEALERAIELLKGGES